MEIPTLIMQETAKLPLGKLRDKTPLQSGADVNLQIVKPVHDVGRNYSLVYNSPQSGKRRL